MFRYTKLWTALAVAGSFAALVAVVPAEAAGRPPAAGGAGGNNQPPVIVPVAPPVVVPPVAFISTSLKATCIGTAAFPTTGGTVNFLRRPNRTALTGTITNTGLPAGTYLDFFVDGVKYQTNPTFPASFGSIPGGTLINTEAGLRLAPALATAISTLHAGSRIEVRVNPTLPLLGQPLTATRSAFAGQLVAVGTFK